MKTERTEVKRKNREIKDELWIKEYLNSARFGVFATCDRNQPLINWNLFIYSEIENAIYFHTSGSGRTRNNIEKNPNLCFSIGNMGEIVFAKKAVNFSVQYQSVIIYGKAEIVKEEKIIMEVFKSYFRKYANNLKEGEDYIPFNIEDARKATLFRLEIEEWSGKMNADKNYADEL